MSRTLALLALLALFPAACGGDKPRQIDLLFVIDHSGSTAEEQRAFGAALPSLFAQLQQHPGGLPSLHVAVIDADMGAGPTAVGTCQPLGHRGAFQVKPGCGLDSANGNWFMRLGGGAEPNFTGAPAETLGCLAQLGVDGCGYEQHLLAMQAALTRPPINLQNLNFLRPGALLAIVFLADEDDCSGDPSRASFYKEDRPGEGLSLRCATLGHVCGGQPVPAQAGFSAPLSSCQPYQRTASELATRPIGVPEFSEWVKRLKLYEDNRVFVGTIAGWDDSPTAQYQIIDRPPGEVALGTACSSTELGQAFPAIRLRAFTKAFANNSFHSICAGDLNDALADIGKQLEALLD